MALPVAPTPVLSGKEAAKFIATIHEEAAKPASLTPTPKLVQARELIRKHAQQQKRIR